MGIIESVLADFKLSDGTEYRIEYNEGDVIHMHVDSFRVDFSQDEFEEFAKVIIEGNEKLQEDKSINESPLK
jgi:hypothetical protein